jgi:predicted enzyme related to lactoylglutathione lyase/limonene-1,2-epoxide hydrolase
MPIEIVRAFAAAINSHEFANMASLFSPDYQFIDAQGNALTEAENQEASWKQYLELFPDYRIELVDVFANGSTVFAHGFASASFKGDANAHWRIPAAWRALIEDGKVKVWQVYADTKIASDIIAANAPSTTTSDKRGVTGLGGVFFKCKDVEGLKEWYKNHLNLDAGKYGASFEWFDAADKTKQGSTQWTPFADSTKYFEPSTKDYMLNYRVANLEAMVAQLKADGVTVLDEIESYDFGKFVHILDLEGNKVELWEPAP